MLFTLLQTILKKYEEDEKENDRVSRAMKKYENEFLKKRDKANREIERIKKEIRGIIK